VFSLPSNITTVPSRDASTASAETLSARLRSLIVPSIVVAAAFVVLISLGNWQVERLTWKEDLIARVVERPTLEPLTVENELLEAAHDDSFFDEYEYRQRLLEGEYDPSHEVLVFTSLSDAKGAFSGPGFWVLTPLVTSPELPVVYVNRGFVPEAARRSYVPPPLGRVMVQGLIRAPEKGSWFTPKPNLAERIFFARDLHKIAAATGVQREVAGFFVDLAAPETPPGGLPQAGETRMAFTNNHLQYAITWYGLAAALLAVFASFVWRRLHDAARGRA
jgi:surfeit locus 1 family protein